MVHTAPCKDAAIFVAIVCGLCCDAADLGCVRGNVDGDLQPADDLPELDLRGSQMASPDLAANSFSSALIVLPANSASGTHRANLLCPRGARVRN
jgi:hypothetical protein